MEKKILQKRLSTNVTREITKRQLEVFTVDSTLK